VSWTKWRGGDGTVRSLARPMPLSRRAFLGGAGTLVGLPLLESLLPRSAWATPTVAPVRLVFWYAPCGIIMDAWTPATVGPLGVLPPILTPLSRVTSEVTVLTGLANEAAIVAELPGEHARGTGSFLTCETIAFTDDADIQNGISVDQVAAAAFTGLTPFKSLELGATGGESFGTCDGGYSCAYSRNVSWADANTPNPKMSDAALVFDRLFAGVDPTLSEAEAEQRAAWRSSVLDHVLEESNELRPKLSASDQLRLDEYLTGVRDLETRIQGATTVCEPGARPPLSLDYPTTVRMMSDLTVLALDCDLTRVVTFMLANAASIRSFDFIGVVGAHHELSHHRGDPAKIDALTQIDTWEVGEFAYLLEQMQGTVDPSGASLLDNALVFFSSELSDGDRHTHRDLPVLVGGRGGGAVTPGQHRSLPAGTPIANLFLTMLDAAGVPAATFGQDGTELLELS
jgi:hypothetical protein